MKTKAAVAVAARHTDEFTRSGADPEGLFPAIAGAANHIKTIRSVVVYS